MRGTTRIALVATMVVGLVVGSAFAGIFGERSAASAPAGAVAAPVLAEAALGVAGRDTTTGLAQLEAAVRQAPTTEALGRLGFAYQLRWRETGDASYLPRSETSLRRALLFGNDDANAVLGLGSLALIQNEFRTALTHGRLAEKLLPGSYRPYGVIGDALIELGRYDAAFASFERMISLRPSLASYARIAYARELSGDRTGAAAAMRLALLSAAGQPEPTAWSHVELAKLELAMGRTRSARRHVIAALASLPGYPSARVELARVEAADGNLRAAIREARRAVAATPTSQAVALLGDLLARARQTAAARRQRATVTVIDRLLEANGVQADLESASYRADNLIRPAETVELARRARADRPSIDGDDALGWALARAGPCDPALPLTERALRLGTQDPLLYFHRGYAEGCAGNRAAMRDWYARALALSPHFSVRWAPVARAALARS